MRRVSRKLMALLMAVLFFAAGVFLIFLGFKNSSQQKTFIPVTGVITRIEAERRPGTTNEYDHRVFVKYRTAEGKEIETELGEYSASFKEGAEIALKYDPADPSNVIAASGTSRIVLFIMGTVGILGSFAIVLSELRH